MDGLFNAESVVVVGVSEYIDNLGKNVISNLVNLGYGGRIYAVGPKGGEVFGLQIYRSISELPGDAELAVILTPARLVSDVLAQCCDKGVRWAVISTAGFRELGTEGELLESEILKTSKRCGIRCVGPNCVGVMNTANSLYTQFIAFAGPFRKGKTAVLAQSGGVGLGLAEGLSAAGVGISKVVSMGNKLDLDEADYLSYLMHDPETDVIYFYLEDFKRGRAFADLAGKCPKPLIVHKSNTGASSSAIALSHTAALAADDQVVDSVCREAQILRVHSVSEAINAAKGLSLPPLKGKNLAVLSRSGGHAVVTADTCAACGFHLPPLDREVLDEAQSRSHASVIRLGNPLDLGDIFSFGSWVRIMKKILSQADIDGVVFILESHMAMEREASRRLVEKLFALSAESGKPVATAVEVPFEMRVSLENLGCPVFMDPVEAVQALAVNFKWGKTEAARHMKFESAVVTASSVIPVKKIEEWFGDIKGQNRQPLLHESLDLLCLTGVPTAPWRMAKDLDGVLGASEELGFPVALKAVSPSLLHKSDRGAIALNVTDSDSLRAEWHRLQKVSNDVLGIVVQKMMPTLRELVIGGKRDLSFGPIVLTGMGGIMVEVLRDVSRRLAPIDTHTALEMLEELSGKRIFGRFRGMGEADIQAAAKILVQVSMLMHYFPQIREMDLNPVSLNDDGKGAFALDARVLID